MPRKNRSFYLKRAAECRELASRVGKLSRTVSLPEDVRYEAQVLRDQALEFALDFDELAR